MARRGWSTSNYLALAAAPASAVPISMSCFARSGVALSLQTLMALNHSGSVFNRNCFRLIIAASGAVQAVTADATTTAQATTGTIITIGEWFHAGAVFAAGNAFRAAYHNGARGSVGTDATSKTPASAPDRLSIGLSHGSTDGQPFAPSVNGDIAWAAIWNTRLEDKEFHQLATGLDPRAIQRQFLLGFWPIIGSSPELNIPNPNQPMTVTGTLSITEQPPLPFTPTSNVVLS